MITMQSLGAVHYDFEDGKPIFRYWAGNHGQVVQHELSGKAHNGKSAEYIKVEFSEADTNWFAYWYCDAGHLPLAANQPLDASLWIKTSRPVQLKLEVNGQVITGPVSRMCGSWTELRMNDIYTAARKAIKDDKPLFLDKIGLDLFIGGKGMMELYLDDVAVTLASSYTTVSVSGATPIRWAPSANKFLQTANRTAFYRGEQIPVTIHLREGIPRPDAPQSSLRLQLFDGENVMWEHTEPAIAKSEYATFIATDLLAPRRYVLRVTVQQPDHGVFQESREIQICLKQEGVFPYGLYGTQNLDDQSAQFDSTTELEDIAAHHMNDIGCYIARISQTNLERVLDQCIRFGLSFRPNLDLYFIGPDSGIVRAVGDQHIRDDLLKQISHVPDSMLAKDANGKLVVRYGMPLYSLMHPDTRKLAAHLTVGLLQRIATHPAYSGYFYFGDDVRLDEGEGSALSDYSPSCLENFKQLTGLDAPRWTAAWNKLTGVVEDDHPWLRWMRFRCETVVGGYQRSVIEAKNSVFPSSKGGPQHGQGVWWPEVGVDPYYELRQTDLLTYYDYPYWNGRGNPLAFFFPSDLAFAGGRDKELWVTPQASGEIATLNRFTQRNQVFSLLASGAKGITFWRYDPANPAAIPNREDAWEEMGRLGLLLKKYGRLFLKLQRTPPKTALLVSFTNAAFFNNQVNTATHIYNQLLAAHIPVETITEQQIHDGELTRYQALVLAGVKVLTPSVAEGLNQFIMRGGTIFADNSCANDLPIAPPRVFAPDVLAEKVMPGVQIDNPKVFLKEFQFDSVPYLMLVNVDLANEAECSVHLDRAGGFLYDLFEESPISARKEKDGHCSFSCKLPPASGKLIALYSRQLTRLSLSLPTHCKSGEKLPLQVAIQDGHGKAVPGLQPLRISLYDPDGTETSYSGYFVAENGICSFQPVLAVNDREGWWTVRVENLANGQTQDASFWLSNRLPPNHSPRTPFSKGSTITEPLVIHWDLVRTILTPQTNQQIITLELGNRTATQIAGRIQLMLPPEAELSSDCPHRFRLAPLKRRKVLLTLTLKKDEMAGEKLLQVLILPDGLPPRTINIWLNFPFPEEAGTTRSLQSEAIP